MKNLSQVTRALETVSASKVRKATQAYSATQPYAEKAWKVLIHLARQPGHNSLHPMLVERKNVKKVMIVMISSDRGLAGAYNVNILRKALQLSRQVELPVEFVAVGKKGRDLLLRRRKEIVADYSDLPPAPSFKDVSSIGRLIVDEFLSGHVDQVFLAYTEFKNMLHQETVVQKILPLEVDLNGSGPNRTHKVTNSVFTYEPEQNVILDEIIPRFTALQVYKAILSSQASEHAARMVAMRNATDSAKELVGILQLEYNKIRQQMITSDLLDIAGGSEALAKRG
ncbi:MAG: ATP synthase F1 subunit gamma [Anaerolineaceae bacterium]|nr:ATP synthase F1 subunit gamma [Anaerolineaceae bacterium]